MIFDDVFIKGCVEMMTEFFEDTGNPLDFREVLVSPTMYGIDDKRKIHAYCVVTAERKAD